MNKVKLTLKAWLAITLVLLIMFSFIQSFHPPVYAANSDFNYELAEDGINIKITGYNGTNGDVVIPGVIDGKNVTELAGGAISGEAITTLQIPASITSIDQFAISCSNLTTIDVDQSNINFSSVEGVLFTKDISVLVKYPPAKTDTGYTLPESVNSISSWAFGNCANLTTIILGSQVTSIDGNAFTFSGITTITIPASTSSIAANAFIGCYSLKSVNVNENSESFSSIDGVLFNKGITSIILYPPGKAENTYVIPDGVTIINNSAFGDSSNLNSVIIPESVNKIGDFAFVECTGLTSITIPGGVTDMGFSIFSNCTNLTSLTIEDGVTSIGISAFQNCTSLTSVVIPSSVTSIGDAAFSACKSLESIIIPSSVTYIGSYEFIECTNLKSIEVNEDNTKYASFDGVLASKDKTELIQYPANKDVAYTIPDSVTTIDSDAFAYSKLENITIPDSVKVIQLYAFLHCDDLLSINVSDNNENFSSVDGVLLNKKKGLLIKYPEGKKSSTYAIPESIKEIGDYAFENGKSLTEIVIPSSVKTIGIYAFANCTSLNSVTVPSSVTVIKYGAFSGCESVKICGASGTIAQQYADENKIPFEIIIFPTPTPDPTVTPKPTANFIDIGNYGWAYDAIAYLSYTNVIVGYGDGTFRPQNDITRAEFIKMLTVAFGIYNPQATSTFDDLEPGAWYIPYVGSAQNEGIAQGTGNNMFSPLKTITREEMFTFAAKAIVKYKDYKLLNNESNGDEVNSLLGQFTDDENVSSWAKPYVATCIKNGLIAGSPVDGGKAIYPTSPITRAEVAVAMNRAMVLQPAKLRIASTLIQFESDTRANILNDIDIMIKKTVDGCNPDMVVISEALFLRRLTDVPSPSIANGEGVPGGQYSSFIAAEAKKYNIYIVFNILEKQSDGTQKNCEAIMDPTGTIVGKYYKMHIPPEEEPYTVPGTDANVIDTEFGKIALNVCYDLDPAFNQDIVALQASKGAKLMICSSIGEYWKGAQDAAIDNGIYTVISGQQEYNFYGTGNIDDPISGIFGPDGTVFAKTDNPTTKGIYDNDGGGSYCFYDIPLSELK